MRKIWRWLEGNKTIIGSLMLNVLAIKPVAAVIPEPWYSITITSVALLTGAALKRHYDKGYFSTKVGNHNQTMKDPLK